MLRKTEELGPAQPWGCSGDFQGSVLWNLPKNKVEPWEQKLGGTQGIPWAQQEGSWAQYINGSSKAVEKKETWKLNPEGLCRK